MPQPRVLPLYHSLCRGTRGCCLERKNWAAHPTAGTQRRQERDGASCLWHLKWAPPCFTRALALAYPTVTGGTGFHPALWDASCPGLPVPSWFSDIPTVPWAKSQGIPMLPVACLGHEGGVGKSLAFWIWAPSCVRAVNNACLSPTHLAGCDETPWKDVHGSASKTSEAVEMFQIPQLLSKQDVIGWVPEKLMRVCFFFVCFALLFFF